MVNPSSRLTKFRLTLEEYDFEIYYLRGKDNVIADALSGVKINSEKLKNLLNVPSVAVVTRAQTK